MGGGALLLSSALACPGPARRARAEQPALFPDDRTLGSAEAPITIIEYSSLTCPHCARLHAEALPKIKENWVETGKARLVYRHYPLGGLALRAAALADCIEGERFFSFLDVLFKSQERWSQSKDQIKSLSALARLAGLSQERVDACLNDQSAMDRILVRARDGQQTYDVESTPTLIINGRKVEGARPYPEMEAILKEIAPQG
jgi:protein-disulfide isomerase